MKGLALLVPASLGIATVTPKSLTCLQKAGGSVLSPCPQGIRLLVQLAAGRAEGLRCLLPSRKRERGGCHPLECDNCCRSLPQQQLWQWLFSGAAGRMLWSFVELRRKVVFFFARVNRDWRLVWICHRPQMGDGVCWSHVPRPSRRRYLRFVRR